MRRHKSPLNPGTKPKPKSAAEERAMIEADAAAVEKWLASHKLVKVTPDGWFRGDELIKKTAKYVVKIFGDYSETQRGRDYEF